MHNIIFVSLDTSPPPPPKVLKLLAGNFGRNILTSSLSDIDVDLFWSTCMVQCIHGNYIQAHMAKRSPSKNKLPYRTKSTIKLKARLYRRAKGLDTLQSWSKYNKCRNNLTSALRSSKKDFFSKTSTPKGISKTVTKPSEDSMHPRLLTKTTQPKTYYIEKANLASCFSKPSQPLPIPSPTTQAIPLLSI